LQKNKNKEGRQSLLAASLFGEVPIAKRCV
jgi:hypothetical protein